MILRIIRLQNKFCNGWCFLLASHNKDHFYNLCVNLKSDVCFKRAQSYYCLIFTLMFYLIVYYIVLFYHLLLINIYRFNFVDL